MEYSRSTSWRGEKSRSLRLTRLFQRVDIEVQVARRLEWSYEESQLDLIRKIEMFSKVGSLMKEWEAEIWPNDPGAVANITGVG